jgi:hypothetical protein
MFNRDKMIDNKIDLDKEKELEIKIFELLNGTNVNTAIAALAVCMQDRYYRAIEGGVGFYEVVRFNRGLSREHEKLLFKQIRGRGII